MYTIHTKALRFESKMCATEQCVFFLLKLKRAHLVHFHFIVMYIKVYSVLFSKKLTNCHITITVIINIIVYSYCNLNEFCNGYIIIILSIKKSTK